MYDDAAVGRGGQKFCSCGEMSREEYYVFFLEDFNGTC